MPILPLPKIMVAPNGARRKKSDHPALPVTIQETVETAKACFAAGATGLHAHVRDENQNHVLDAGLYKELIAEMQTAVPQMQVQITTEAIGIYTPAEQRALAMEVMPKSVSISLNEMLADGDDAEPSKFYHWANDNEIAVQHILYEPSELSQLINLVDKSFLPANELQLLFVLGRYSVNQESSPDDLVPFLNIVTPSSLNADWAVCAFGKDETACLANAIAKGGKARVGFENSLWNEDGVLAKDNAERVSTIAKLI
ncbi:MAG: 3-keto-5-aminohexanoate cleavage protein [Rhizobiaceae bacterium]|nr:3-keto-5-aminohexanoate cleavage protein [Rhizobiaceae bacterium]